MTPIVEELAKILRLYVDAEETEEPVIQRMLFSARPSK